MRSVFCFLVVLGLSSAAILTRYNGHSDNREIQKRMDLKVWMGPPFSRRFRRYLESNEEESLRSHEDRQEITGSSEQMEEDIRDALEVIKNTPEEEREDTISSIIKGSSKPVSRAIQSLYPGHVSRNRRESIMNCRFVPAHVLNGEETEYKFVWKCSFDRILSRQ